MTQPTNIVVIPGGAAELRDKVTVGGQQLLQEEGVEFFEFVRQRWPNADRFEEIPKEQYTRQFLFLIHRWQKAAVAALVRSWTLPTPVPRTLEEVDEMDPEVYKVLAARTSPLAFQAMQGLKLEPVVKEDGTLDRDPANPTSTSSDSGSPSADPTTPETGPAESSSEDGASSATDEPSPASLTPST